MSKSLLRDQRGNVAVIFGLCLPVLGLGMGIAVDFSNGTRQQADLQTAADAAALAGARKLGISEGKEADRETAATATAKQFLASSAGAVLDPEVVSSLDEGSVTVRVSVETPQYFGALIGRETQSISAAAKATFIVDEITGCMIALSSTAPVGIRLEGSPDLSATQCGIWSNSATATSISTQGSGKAKAYEICAVGSLSGRTRGLTPVPETGCDPSPDPFAGRLPAPPTDCRYTNFVATNGKPLEPGTYCGGINVANNSVTFNPGLYVLVDGPLQINGSGSVNGAEVSILLTGAGANLHLQGSPSLTLTAMKTGAMAGIALAMADDGRAKTAVLWGSPDVNVTGSMYLPSTHLRLEGSPSLTLSGAHDKLAAHSFSLIGSPELRIEADDRNNEAFDLAKLRLVR